MQTSGFAELSDFHAPEPQRARRAPGLLAFAAGLFARRIGGRIEQGVLLMAAPLTYQAMPTRADVPRQLAHEARSHAALDD